MKLLPVLQRAIRGEAVEGLPMKFPPPVAELGIACASTLELGESFTTVDLRTTFFRPVKDGLLEARARVVNGGRTMVYAECDVVLLPDGKLVAKSSCTCMILRGDQASRL